MEETFTLVIEIVGTRVSNFKNRVFKFVMQINLINKNIILETNLTYNNTLSRI